MPGNAMLLLKFTQKALKERGIDSMLDEARENNRESDAELMRKSCKHLQYADSHECC